MSRSLEPVNARNVFFALLGIFLALAVMDSYYTYANIVILGHGVEGNPNFAPFVGHGLFIYIIGSALSEMLYIAVSFIVGTLLWTIRKELFFPGFSFFLALGILNHFAGIVSWGWGTLSCI